jgi:tRNA threonylcarbamoyladenosine biosynthesis protein TsaB
LKILAVDTALGACSAAILDDETVSAHCWEPMERGHAERLAPMVRETMVVAGLDFVALDRLAVTIGPGTFTGQRVGYAFMRGLRLALQRPLIGLTTLEAMAEAALSKTDARCAAVFHDAKREEVYVTAVDAGKTVVPVQIATFENAVRLVRDAVRHSGGAIALAGTAAASAHAALRNSGIDDAHIVLTDIAAPDALWVARMARFEQEPEAVPRPLYLRPPNARLPGAPR